jgi:hypothetical protein
MAASSATKRPIQLVVAHERVRVSRIAALDFTKGTLVLFMVLYHWLNYFVSPQGEFYRYIRFVSPSFIFITGFLISNVYFSRYQMTNPQLPKRLVIRGLKILGIFVALNLAIAFLFSRSYDGQITFLSTEALRAVFVAGNTGIVGSGKAAAFYILVPIGYLLLLSAGLTIAARYFRYVFHVACIAGLLGVFLLWKNFEQSGNLEMLSIGLLGVVAGDRPLDVVKRIAAHRYILLIAYVCYLAAIVVFNVAYPLLIAGVFLNLMLFFVLGELFKPHAVHDHIVLLGNYSLFAYIAQIAILQFLYRGLRHADVTLNTVVLAASFVAAFVLTSFSVVVMQWMRTKTTVIDRGYKALFA